MGKDKGQFAFQISFMNSCKHRLQSPKARQSSLGKWCSCYKFFTYDHTGFSPFPGPSHQGKGDLFPLDGSRASSLGEALKSPFDKGGFRGIFEGSCIPNRPKTPPNSPLRKGGTTLSALVPSTGEDQDGGEIAILFWSECY